MFAGLMQLKLAAANMHIARARSITIEHAKGMQKGHACVH
jgi:hypothetical protein